MGICVPVAAFIRSSGMVASVLVHSMWLTSTELIIHSRISISDSCLKDEFNLMQLYERELK